LLGIDGGGTRTVALLAKWSRELPQATPLIIGRGAGGPANYQAVGRAGMVQSLNQAIREAFDAAGLAPVTVAAACLGLAGADRPADQQRLTDWCADTELATNLSIVNDGRLVLAAGTPCDWGIALIAGTGSFVLARLPDGQMRRAGGWGYLFGDEGSAYTIALSGLRAVTRAHDRTGPDTSLVRRMLERLQVPDVPSIVPAIYGAKLARDDIARLAEVVTEAAQTGDAAAIECLRHAATELAATAAGAATVFTPEFDQPIPVALSGSLLTRCHWYSNEVLVRFRERLPALGPVTFVQEPARGAIELARRTLSAQFSAPPERG
jgi:N-acetylglucosamine kinase-like BadF-type ATPase